MTIEFWVGSNFSTTHERKAIKDFLDSAYQLFSPRQEPFYVLSNFYLGGRQIDLVLIKPNSILVVDLKDCAEPFQATENGPWQIIDTKASIGTGTKNPYQQIKELRNTWIDELAEREELTHKVSKLSLRKFVHGAIVVSPELNTKTENKIPRSAVWFHLFGLSSLPNDFLSLSCPSVALDPKDIQKFIREHLRLSPGEFSTGLVFEPLSRKASVPSAEQRIPGAITGKKSTIRARADEKIVSNDYVQPSQAPNEQTSFSPQAVEIPISTPEHSVAMQSGIKKKPSQNPLVIFGGLGLLLCGIVCCLIPGANYVISAAKGSVLPADPKQRQLDMLQNSRIAYVFENNIYTMTAYGNLQTQLTVFQEGEEVDEISWSPDGKSIVFSVETNDQSDLYIMDIATKQMNVFLQTPQDEYAPCWSPDGTYIYYTGNRNENRDIYRMLASGGNEERITDFPSWEYDPDVSLDSKAIIFISNMGGDWDVYRLILSEGSLLRVSRDGGTQYMPKYRPGSEEISYLSMGGQYQSDYFYYTNMDTLKTNRESVFRQSDIYHYDWSPDGSVMVKADEILAIYDEHFDMISGLVFGMQGITHPAWSPVL